MSARLIRYTLDGIKLTHDISFGVTDGDGFDVYVNRTKLDKGIDYKVVGTDKQLRDGDGVITLTIPHAASDVLLILSDTLARRVTNFAKAARFEEAEIDSEFDNLLRLLEDASLYLTSTPYFNPIDIGLVDGQLPALIAGGVLRVNEHKNGFELVELDKVPEFLEVLRKCTEQADRSEGEANKSKDSADRARSIADSIGQYRGLWPIVGGSALKGDTWQLQVGGIASGRYFLALKNTAVSPIGDNVNWKEEVSKDSLPTYTKIAYRSEGGKTSVENMIAGVPMAIGIGGVCTTSHTVWKRVAVSDPAVISDFSIIESTPRVVSDISELAEISGSISVGGRVYNYNGLLSEPDGVSFSGGAVTISKSGNSYQAAVRDRQHQYIHLNQMMHVKGQDAAKYVDVATSAGFIVDITGWVLVLDSGYSLSTVIHGRGVIKQRNGDDGIIVESGGGFDHFVVIDGEISSGVFANKKRPVRFNANSIAPFAHDLTIRNYHSTTFINALMIDNQGIRDFEIKRLTVENLKADANGVVGDANGVCRGVNFASRAAEPVSVSSGVIDGFTGRNFGVWEDCDGVAIQAFVGGKTVTADVALSNIKTREVLKRAVKIQANEVSVRAVDARSNNPKAMYSIVSCYAEGCKIANVRGRGAINSGVDVLGYAKVDDVNVFSDSTFEPGAALLILGGGCDANSITGNGMESVVSVRSVSAPVSKVNLSSVSGSSKGVPLWIRPDNSNDIDLVIYSGVDVSCTTKGIYALTNDTSGTGELKTVIIGGEVVCFNDHFYNIFLNGVTQRAEIKSARFDGDSVGGAKIIGGEVFIGNVSSNKTLTVEIENTTKAFINGVEGKLKLVNTSNTDAAMYQELEESGVNANLRKMSWT
ncbi:conserved hypothetical protein [Vibrio phage 456E52-1]|nr:conserved hypothetical protein [Vibrio phage 456E52-1]